MKWPTRSLLVAFFLALFGTLNQAQGLEQIGRLGVGMTQALKNDIPALSFKFQRSPAFAMGGMVGLSTDDQSGGYGAGLKLYRVFFDEPQLNFYGSVMGALIKEKNNGDSLSGYQFDFTLGSEFSFSGLQSLGFSFEFGISMNKKRDMVIETVGNNFFVAAVHFYL